MGDSGGRDTECWHDIRQSLGGRRAPADRQPTVHSSTGNNLQGFEEFHTKNGPNQGHNLDLDWLIDSLFFFFFFLCFITLKPSVQGQASTVRTDQIEDMD